MYCSDEAHYSVDRAVELLGIGSAGVRALAVDERRRLRPAEVDAAIEADVEAGITPVAVVATAGTTLTGAIDPIAELADICEARGVWLHVDGAYGLPAAGVESTRSSFRGLERAHSVSLDAHKWLYLPKACGVVLVRDRSSLTAAFAHEEGYLPHEHTESHAADLTLEYSRPFRALKLWLAFRAHGAEAFREAIERNLAHARMLVDEVRRHGDLELLTDQPQLSIVPFRHVPPGDRRPRRPQCQAGSRAAARRPRVRGPGGDRRGGLPAAVLRQLPHRRLRRPRPGRRRPRAGRGAGPGRCAMIGSTDSGGSRI